MKKMMKIMLGSISVIILFTGGIGTAYAVKRLHRVNLKPGHCVRVKRPRERVCAKRAHTETRTRVKTRTVTHTITQPVRTVTAPAVTVNLTKTETPETVTETETVSPSPIGETFSGVGDKTLAPITLPHGVNVSWTAQPDSYGDNLFQVTGDDGLNFVAFDNGDSATSGTSYIPAGTYTLDVSASSSWTLSF